MLPAKCFWVFGRVSGSLLGDRSSRGQLKELQAQATCAVVSVFFLWMYSKEWVDGIWSRGGQPVGER